MSMECRYPFTRILCVWNVDTLSHAQLNYACVLVGSRMVFTPPPFRHTGVFLRVQDVFWPLRAVIYVVPVRWAFPSYDYALMAHESQLDEAFACNATTFEPVDGPFVNTTVVQCKTYSLDAQGHGFFCAPHVPPYSCLGRTGLQVLDTLELTFSTIMSKDPVVGDAMWYSYLGLTLANGMFWKLLYLFAVQVILLLWLITLSLSCRLLSILVSHPDVCLAA